MPAPRELPFWVAGRPIARSGGEVISPVDGSVAGRHGTPSPQEAEAAVAAAEAAVQNCRGLPAADRAEALNHVAGRIAARADEFAELITAESGKPIRWSRAEVRRAVSTFAWAAGEAQRWSGQLQRLDTDPAAAGRLALVRRFPVGPVLGITPFNFPLNLVAHKVAPAIAVGAPIVIKPAPATPLTALLLGELLAETGLPEGSWSVLPVGNEAAAGLARDPRLPVVSFTGSERVGMALRDELPGKRVILELGGNAAAVVLADYPDLARAAERIATFGTYQAGQSCISVQRVLVDEPIAEDFLPLLADAVRALPAGSPWDENTVVGPLISAAAADRVEAWIAESGGSVLVGGPRRGNEVPPTLLTGVPAGAKVVTEEVFGPVLVVDRVRGADGAIAAINASRFGLQAGVFTRDLPTAFRLHRELQVGGVVIGDVPSYRADQMPYGGTKSSGQGREGLRSAMTDLTEERVLVLTDLDL